MKDFLLKKYMLNVWNIVYNIFQYTMIFVRVIVDRGYALFHKPPVVIEVKSSISYIMEHRCSVARYGDGEMKLIMGNNISFQKSNPHLKERLFNILSSNDSNLVICIPNIFESLDIYTDHDKAFWREYLSRSRKMWYKLLDKNRTYYDAFVSRCYLPYREKSGAAECFRMWQQLWNNRDLLIVEGAKTRFGVGNDLLDNAKSIQRILGPVTNAFDKYDDILNEVVKYDKGCLILIALGPTATVLAADLSLAGYQAIDIGHLDIEYEWFLMHADHKVPVDGKYVNEAGGFHGSEDTIDKDYQSQIVKVID